MQSQSRIPIKIKFISSRWVKALLKKFSELCELKIFISNDLTKEEKEERKITLDCVNKLKVLGQNAFIRRDKIMLNRKLTRLEEANAFLSIINKENLITMPSIEPSHDDLSTPKRGKGRPRKETKLKNKRLESFFPTPNAENKQLSSKHGPGTSTDQE